ncbi:transmembrane and coiled-coil domain-containing protein 4-like isoform X1 [Gigantopelta aegis]|uniref:transmembrane and coiled-coil domain-containing protein 4-like isoform X1 n=1 Tax=Gigantopelta aegis TaxID=1735272 RepID=UPI001B88B3A4|nr:transmembrane and coiled-coil domain-containing protein 4-like isoform X1 [Gigantopelta aegis]
MAEGGLGISSAKNTSDVQTSEINSSNNGSISDIKGQLVTGKSFVPLCKHLTDVGNYSYSALCAMSLRLLFEDLWHRKFKKETLKMILKYMDQPEQVRVSIEALLDGHGMDETSPYIELLLDEKYLQKSGDLVITDMVAMAVRNGCYDSRLRVLIKHVAWQLHVTWDRLEDIESCLALALDDKQYEQTQEEIAEKNKEQRKSKAKRIALIGLATVGGGALIGLTGGLAAPLVAVGAGAIIGGAGAAVLGSTAGVAIIGSLFGAAGAGLAGYKMKRRMGEIEEFEFEQLPCDQCPDMYPSKQLHITIAVTGWVTDEQQDFRLPWRMLAESREQYSLKWESQYLLQLGTALDYIVTGAVSVATQEALKYTILSGIIAAIAWPSVLLSVANVIDNPWSVAMQRAHSTGKKLAEVLLAREQGKRPVTLIGFSLGARVIYTCLKEMAKRKGSDGIVEDVILLGAPVSGAPQFWEPLGRVVGGKIINGYCRADWLLKFLYRTASVQIRVAGLGPVRWENRRMHNIDLSDVVSGHIDYLNQLDTILKVVGVKMKHNASSRTEVEESKNSIYANTDASPVLKSRLIPMKAATPVDEESGLSLNLDELTSSDDELTSSDDENKASESPTRSPRASELKDSIEKDYKVSLCKKGSHSFVVKAKISTSSVESDKDLCDESLKDIEVKNKSSNKSDVFGQTEILSSSDFEKCQVTEEVDSCEDECANIDDFYESFEGDNVLSQKLSNVDYYHLTFEDD